MTSAAAVRGSSSSTMTSVLPLIERFARSLPLRRAHLPERPRSPGRAPRSPSDAALVDLQMPELSGIDVLKEIGASQPDCQVILMTGDAIVDTAIEAVKAGALHDLSKPLDFDRLEALLDAVSESRGGASGCCPPKRPSPPQIEFNGIHGRGAIMQQLFASDPPAGPARPNGPGHRRDRYRQGTGGTGAPRRRLAPRETFPHLSTAPPSSKRCSRASCSDM